MKRMIWAAFGIGLAACSSGGNMEPRPGSSSSSGGGEGGNGGGSTATSTSSSSSSSSGGQAIECKETKVPGSGQSAKVGTVIANAVDTSGAPVQDVLVQLCGLNLCLGDTTNGAGYVNVNGNGFDIIQPAFKVGDGLIYARMLRPLGPGDVVFDPFVTPKLPPLAEGAKLAAGTIMQSAGTSLELAPDGVFEVDILLFDDPATQVYRAAAVPASAMDPSFVAAGPKLEAFHALAPTGALLCPPAKFTMANEAGWAAGASVEFFVLGMEVSEIWAPYGEFAKVSDGRVSDDGKTISTTDGQGLPILGIIGVRRVL
jgi:hypothetical protein